MDTQIITCPKCGTRIPLNKALTAQIEASLRAEFEARTVRQQKEIEAVLQKKFAAEIAQKEAALKEKVKREVSEELSRMRRAVAEAEQKRKQVELLQQKLARREREIEAEVTKKMNARLRQIEQETAARLEEEYRTRQLQLERKLQEARRQTMELKQKLEQGSRQEQGDIAEEELSHLLANAFPEDKIERIGKGRSGADVLQRVIGPNGVVCGTIIWESKHTASWSNAWLAKLREDQRRAKADLAVLVSRARPKNGMRFGRIDGVWITEPALIKGVATALRTQLVQIATLKQRPDDMNEKMKLLYRYISGVEFKQRVEAIVETFAAMRDDVAKERNMMEKQWAKREKQLALVLENMAGMYGDMQAMAGRTLPKIRHLELTEG